MRDNQDRMQSYPTDLQKLTAGVFYGNEYFKALKAKGQQTRLNFFLNKNSFFDGYASPKHFDVPKSSETPTGVMPNCFIIKPDVLPSDALKAMRTGLSFIGCGETCLLGIFEGLQAAWGTDKFNALFSRKEGTPLIIKVDTKENPLWSIWNQRLHPTSFVKGRVYHFNNAAPDYQLKHQNGEALGYTALCIDDTPEMERFVTLGLNPEGMSRWEIEEILLSQLNETPIDMEIVTPALAARILTTVPPFVQSQRESMRLKQYTLSEFHANGGGSILAEFTLDMDKITQIARKGIPAAVKVFKRWNAERTRTLRRQGII